MRAILLMLSLPIFMLPVDACFSSIFGRSNDETTKNARAEHEKDGKITMSREDASKLYLQKYGYLRGLRVVVGDKTEEVAITDDEMKKALSMFQEFIGLEANGLLSNETVEKMQLKRCGVRDVKLESNEVTGIFQCGLAKK
ncbi:hypothetical protein AB6A40_004355 [Gnathostoma spinigerum]|uniref:Peptidoglycan binding-like domain-containing protein n=1 Tax=Gnathostoma spinigerum TaxID=75299 RepID=A0ABD6EDB2_9BILA